MVEGQPDEYRTPFYRGKSVEDILKGWDKTLRTIQSQWPSLYEFEIDLRSKVGPMSIMKPLNDRMEDIDHYYDLISGDHDLITEKALESVIKRWLPMGGSVTMKGQLSTLQEMKLNTNSGLPYFQRRGRVVDKTMPVKLSYHSSDTGACTQILGPDLSSFSTAAILGWRGQEGGPNRDDVKQRVVWMFPFAVNIEELRVYQPLIAYAQRHNIVPAWVSMDAVDMEITQLFDTKGKDDLIVCTDFSKFDQHFNSALQEGAYFLLNCIMRPSADFEYWQENVFPIKYSIPLAYNWESIRTGKHGMASGSGGTNADETLVHMALQYEAAQSSGTQLNPHSQCLGDDGILSYPGITVDDVVESYTRHGLEMNKDKQYASTTDCTYLRRWHHKDYRVNNVCVGVYSTYRALGRLCEMERYYSPDIWSAKMVALRQLSILENCKWHPLREEFVRYCMKGDKFRLGLDIPGFLDKIESEARKATDVMPDFLGYTKSMQSNMSKRKDKTAGINDWWIVNFLRSQR